MRILMVDNYDSFTFNLVHYLESFDCEVITHFGDQLTLEQTEGYDGIVISPGPKLPSDTPFLNELIQARMKDTKILGVCLGHQAIAEALGAELINLPTVYHGRTSKAHIEIQDPLFHGIATPFQIGKYHSWSVKESVTDLEVLATDEITKEILAFRHKTLPLRGVQFHPESILTPQGKKIIENWLFRL